LLPSWSWASIFDNGGRIFRPTSQGGDVLLGHRVKEDTRNPSIPSGFHDRHAQVVKVDIVPQTFDRNGHFGSAKLVLKGLCRKVIAKRRGPCGKHPCGQSPGFFIFEIEGLEPKSLNQYVFPSIDHPSWLEKCLKDGESSTHDEGYSLACLFLKNTSGLHCLLLYQAGTQDGGPLYKRCGAVNIEYHLDRFEHSWHMDTVTII
jgi:hypothetical protein